MNFELWTVYGLSSIGGEPEDEARLGLSEQEYITFYFSYAIQIWLLIYNLQNLGFYMMKSKFFSGIQRSTEFVWQVPAFILSNLTAMHGHSSECDDLWNTSSVKGGDT